MENIFFAGWLNLALSLLVIFPFVLRWFKDFFTQSISVSFLIFKMFFIILTLFILLLPNFFGYYHPFISIFYSLIAVVVILNYMSQFKFMKERK